MISIMPFATYMFVTGTFNATIDADCLLLFVDPMVGTISASIVLMLVLLVLTVVIAIITSFFTVIATALSPFNARAFVWCFDMLFLWLVMLLQ